MVTAKISDTTVLTIQGRLIDFKNITADDIDVLSISNNLSHLCRFGGGTPYTVLDHTVLGTKVCEILGLDQIYVKSFFLHDFCEGVTGVDMPSPLKNLFPEYRLWEEGLQRKIFALFDSWHFLETSLVDYSMYFLESNLLMPRAIFEKTPPAYDLQGVEFDEIHERIATPVDTRLTLSEFHYYCNKFSIE